jgi:NADPH:quinone reductase
MKMHGWQVNEYGHYHDAMAWQEMDRPTATGKDAIVKVGAIGLNFPDILMVAGKYQVKPPLPFVPGTEMMGTVVETGPDCELAEGDRVMAMSGIGAFAEYCLAPDGARFKVPDEMSDEDAASFQMIYQTSYFGLDVRANLQPGEVLLVHGGAGGVGSSAIQLGKALGATVIATAGTEAKLDVCRQCGADHAVNYATDDFVQVVKDVTHGNGADVVYDPVGGDVFDLSTKCIAWNGRILVIGFTSGRIPEIRTNRILLKNMSVVGLHWGAYRIHQPHLIEQAQDKLYDLYQDGKIKPVIFKEYALSDLNDALDAIEQRLSYGKIVVKP